MAADDHSLDSAEISLWSDHATGMEVYFADCVGEYFDYGVGYCVNELDDWIWFKGKKELWKQFYCFVV